jgi:shikimate kinase
VTHIILTGFMGTGKTEVGRRLAQELGRTFVDTDRLVETTAGRTIAEVFASEGETGFRARERAEACALPEAVVATGGGALTDPENRRRLAAAGPIVCLTATPEEILRRVGAAEDRPLLAGATSDAARLDRVRELLAARSAVYAGVSHTVETTGLTIDQVVERVRTAVEVR